MELFGKLLRNEIGKQIVVTKTADYRSEKIKVTLRKMYSIKQDLA